MKPRTSGFTLIEVLVALAIVAFGMTAVLAAMTSAADNAFFMRDKTLAKWIALNQIATQRLKDSMPKKGKTDGEVEDFTGRNWVWQEEVQPLQFKGMWRIDVSVRPLQAGENKNDALSKKSGWYATESGVMGDAVDRNWLDVDLYWNISKGSVGSQGQKGGTNGGRSTSGSTTGTPKEDPQ